MSDHEVVYRVVCPDGTHGSEVFRSAFRARYYANRFGKKYTVQSGIISWDEE